MVNASQARKEEAEKRIKFYYDEQVETLRSIIARQWAQPESFRFFFMNLVRYIVDQRSHAYADWPLRTFEGADQDMVEEIYAEAGVNLMLKRANRMTSLLKTSMVSVLWDDEAQGLDVRVVTPNVIDVKAANPWRPRQVFITHDAGQYMDRQFSDWTPEAYRLRDWRGAIIEEMPNPYGVVPLVPCFDYAPNDRFFLNGGDDLISSQTAINLALMNVHRALEIAVHGMPVVTGVEDTDFQMPGIGRALTLPHKDARFEIVKPESAIKDAMAVIEAEMKFLGISYGLSSSAFELDRPAESGASKVAERTSLEEHRRDQLELWRIVERRVFETIKRVWNHHRPDKAIPENATVNVDFADPGAALSETERLEAAVKRRALGVWNEVDVLLDENADLNGDRKEAIRLLQEKREESAMISNEGNSFNV
jgi:hypothetical protein